MEFQEGIYERDDLVQLVQFPVILGDQTGDPGVPFQEADAL